MALFPHLRCRFHPWLAGWGVALFGLTLSGRGLAADVTFEADQADVDVRSRNVKLRGNVQVNVGRHRLYAPKLELRRVSPDTVEVEGTLRFQLCECDDPPISFEVQTARVNTYGDASLKRGSVLCFGRRLLTLPWIQLRGPYRVGFMVPSVAWRAQDGLRLGQGIHLPLSRYSFTEITPSAYLKGGVHTRWETYTPWSITRVEFDHLQSQTGLKLRSRGAKAVSGGQLGFRVDGIRGERALVMTTALDPAARRFDDLRAQWGVGSGALRASAGVLGAARRGEGALSVGPALSFGWSEALGSGLSLRFSGFGHSAGRGDGATRQGGWLTSSLDFSTWLGPLQLRGDGVAQARGRLEGRGQGGLLQGSSGAALGLPGWRSFGERTTHFVEPTIFARGLSLRPRGMHGAAQLPSEFRGGGSELVFGAGLENRLGHRGRGSLALEFKAGTLARSTSRPWLARVGLGAESRWVRLRGIGLASWQPAEGELEASRSYGAEGEVALGKVRGLRVRSRTSYQKGEGAQLARFLRDRVQAFPLGGLLASQGGSSNIDVRAPLGRGFVLHGGASWALSDGERLGEQLGALFQHPCGCLALGGFGSRRIGREGIDVGLLLQIVPNRPAL